ncbi:D-alanyl-D-alanine carboxypeptidase family protein [Stenotrophomonas sp. C1657]|uniref:M15 family metallopeptidase n=1 Tax=Stenotrophomonas sp. C1657 TaxID=3077844 RepID=UPI00293D1217|nr:D-alanyl-D-alanine carboxypeptidase family protein [Stenotrophomonas sp. C1657]MDV3513349.1 D-alanyl-D-alanine carboxypeptidase family protein [Stenotrophomonas sp. C1657]
MHRITPLLINTETVELWPAPLLRARSNLDARLLARAQWVLRRKRDGRYLAAVLAHGVHSLVPRLPREPGVGEALALLDGARSRPFGAALEDQWLQLVGLQQRLQQLGLDAQRYAHDSGLALEAEPCVLHWAGRDRFARPLWLRRGAAQGWRRMRLHAARDGIALDAISGFRSHAYQLGIFERKLARGQSVPQILKVNAAPGFSEHHSGHALDIGTPGDAPAEETFEATAAFAWLQANAAAHGFHLSYPRDNPHGIVYEPWHWCWKPANG